MIVVEYGISIKDLWKDFRKNVERVGKYSLLYTIGKKIGMSEEEIMQAIRRKEYERIIRKAREHGYSIDTRYSDYRSYYYEKMPHDNDDTIKTMIMLLPLFLSILILIRR